tara:strand:+ start:6160 stop:7011 length:852 start_codon:yes stop_codon:yes gene_type:complete
MSFTYSTLKTALQQWTENSEATFISNLSFFIKNAEERILKEVDLDYFRKNVTGTTTSDNQFLAVPTDYLASFSLSVTNSSTKEFLLQKDVNFIQEFNPTSATGTPKYYAVYDYQNFILSPVPDTSYSAELHYFYRPDSLTVSQFVLTLSSVTGTFVDSETITGSTSGATTTIGEALTSTTSRIIIPSTDFTVGETVTGATSGATGTVVSTGADSTLTWVSENAPNALLYASLIEAYTFMKGETDILQLYIARYAESLQRLKNYADGVENTDAYREGLVRANKT